jgi:segregation and condensation protein B
MTDHPTESYVDDGADIEPTAASEPEDDQPDAPFSAAPDPAEPAAPAERPSDPTRPAQASTDEPTDEPTGAAVDGSDVPAGTSAGLLRPPAGGLSDEPTDELTGEPADEAVGEPTDEPTDEAIDEAIWEVAGPGDEVSGAWDELDEGVPEQQTEIPVGPEEVVDDATMRRAIEAILMVSDEPLPALTLARAVGRATNDVTDALVALAAEYTEQGRGFDLREVAGGWRYYTREDAAAYMERFVLDGQQARLTQAALETLAVVAYKQPVSRGRVSAIRGVNVDGVMRTLVTRGLVEEAGTDTESQATLYRTTTYFLERMGMQILDDLPELAPYLPEMDDIEDELTPPAPHSDVPTGHSDTSAEQADVPIEAPEQQADG